ncbi:MAG: dethiobiotin synthase [Bacteroidota bacterium]|nr:dethiobiotin synthase [Bacteroidota bacterium]MEC7954364.1 dethiobiotin synthase [Bacteroidota bacterium]MEC8407823.1 dethiobiotin synthase [Bacteroidota bacterium]MEC8605785.1 dethiobiotin synthase [Bacteroidota bacterium]MEC9231109.1 dethiobiotin synthase [Bacteroidota bacterium]
MRIFVTSIDTNVGKTVCSSILCAGLGYDYWKPVQCGDLDFSDSMKVKSYSPLTKVHAESFQLNAPMSPHEAAKLENMDISINDFKLPKSEEIIIEGAGGVMVPLNYKGNMIVELASMFEAKVIIVFKNYLGSINHTLLTIDKVKSVGLDILGLLVVGDEVTSSERIIEDATQMNIIARIPIVDRVNQKWVKEQGLKVKNKLDKFL